MVFKEQETGFWSGDRARERLLRTARVEEILREKPISPEIERDSRNWRRIGGLAMKDVYLPVTGPLAQEKVVVCLSRRDSPETAIKMAETSEFLRKTPNRYGYFLDLFASGSIGSTGQKWQVVEYVDGVELQNEDDKWMKGVDLSLKLEALLAGCRCMEEVIKQGVMLEDLSPNAFMVNDDGKVKLVDCTVTSLTEKDPKLKRSPNVPGDIGEEMVRLALTMFPGLYIAIGITLFGLKIREAFWRFSENKSVFFDLLKNSDLPAELTPALLTFTERMRSGAGASAIEMVRDLSNAVEVVRDRAVEEKTLRQAEDNARFRIDQMGRRDMHPMEAGVIVWSLLFSLSRLPEERRRKIAGDSYPNYKVPLAQLYSYILYSAMSGRANLTDSEISFPARRHPGEVAYDRIKSIVGLCSSPDFKLRYDDEAFKLGFSQLIEALHRMTPAQRDRLAGATRSKTIYQLYADLVEMVLGTRE